MKENKLMKMVAFLLVATLITTVMVSGVLAQYTTKTESSNTARVAQWGVVTFAEGKLFTTKDPDGNHIVAPGDQSSANGLTFGLSGTPEVDGEISAAISQENIFLAAGTWGIMVEATGVTAANIEKNNLIMEDIIEEEIVEETKAEENKIKEAEETETEKAETEETQTEETMMEETETEGIITAKKADVKSKIAENVMAKKGTAQSRAGEADGSDTYYTFDAITETYIKVEDQPYDANTTYYTLSNEVTIEASGYWPVVFEMEGVDGVGYKETQNEPVSVNTLGGVENTLNGILASDTSFKAKENLIDQFRLSNQQITWKWDNCTIGCDKNAIEISGGESESLCDICRADIILQKLMAQGTSNTAVVVKNPSADTFRTPTASSDGTNGDYNLKVNFDLNLAVTQTEYMTGWIGK